FPFPCSTGSARSWLKPAHDIEIVCSCQDRNRLFSSSGSKRGFDQRYELAHDQQNGKFVRALKLLILPDFFGVVPFEVRLNRFEAFKCGLWPIRKLPIAKPFQIARICPVILIAKGIKVPPIRIDIE